MSRKAALSICLGIALGIVGCQNETTEPAATAEGTGQALAVAAHHLKLNPAALKNSAGLRDRVLGSSAHVIDPEAYKCRQATRIGNWFNSQLNQIPLPVLRSLILDLAAPDVSLIEGFVFEPSGPQEFGYTGEFNSVMPSIATSVKGFWNFTSPNVLLGTMKGAPVLTNIPLVTFIYENFFVDSDANGNPIPVTHAEALELATQLHDLVVNTRALNGGDHPLFSFNAFSIPAIPGFVPNKIIMGDGVLEGFAAAGLGNIAALAPQAVYAHEFGHQIQFKNGYDTETIPGQTPETSPAEFTQYTELMADTYSGYYLAHQNLGKTTKQQIRDAERAFFNLGDCAFDDAGHHGTPNQRQAAVDFGIQLASEAGPVLSEQAVHARFVDEYLQIIAPDAPQASR